MLEVKSIISELLTGEALNLPESLYPPYSYEGIEIHDIADWLLQE